MKSEEQIWQLRAALNVVLDQIDYLAGNCSQTDLVGAALPKNVIEFARNILKKTKS